jgi:hypothetical protein
MEGCEQFYREPVVLVTMLQELLLNFGLSKRELCNFVQMSMGKLNFVLQDPSQVRVISNEQARRIKNYYYAMIQYAPDERLTMSYLELLRPVKRKGVGVAENSSEEKNKEEMNQEQESEKENLDAKEDYEE